MTLSGISSAIAAESVGTAQTVMDDAEESSVEAKEVESATEAETSVIEPSATSSTKPVVGAGRESVGEVEAVADTQVEPSAVAEAVESVREAETLPVPTAERVGGMGMETADESDTQSDDRVLNGIAGMKLSVSLPTLPAEIGRLEFATWIAETAVLPPGKGGVDAKSIKRLAQYLVEVWPCKDGDMRPEGLSKGRLAKGKICSLLAEWARRIDDATYTDAMTPLPRKDGEDSQSSMEIIVEWYGEGGRVMTYPSNVPISSIIESQQEGTQWLHGACALNPEKTLTEAGVRAGSTVQVVVGQLGGRGRQTKLLIPKTRGEFEVWITRPPLTGGPQLADLRKLGTYISRKWETDASNKLDSRVVIMKDGERVIVTLHELNKGMLQQHLCSWGRRVDEEVFSQAMESWRSKEALRDTSATYIAGLDTVPLPLDEAELVDISPPVIPEPLLGAVTDQEETDSGGGVEEESAYEDETSDGEDTELLQSFTTSHIETVDTESATPADLTGEYPTRRGKEVEFPTSYRVPATRSLFLRWMERVRADIVPKKLYIKWTPGQARQLAKYLTTVWKTDDTNRPVWSKAAPLDKGYKADVVDMLEAWGSRIDDSVYEDAMSPAISEGLTLDMRDEVHINAAIPVVRYHVPKRLKQGEEKVRHAAELLTGLRAVTGSLPTGARKYDPATERRRCDKKLREAIVGPLTPYRKVAKPFVGGVTPMNIRHKRGMDHMESGRPAKALGAVIDADVESNDEVAYAAMHKHHHAEEVCVSKEVLDTLYGAAAVPHNEGPPIDPEEIRGAIKNHKKGTAGGEDGLTMDHLRDAIAIEPEICVELARLFQCMLDQAWSPESVSTSRLLALPKPGKSPHDISGWRPVAISNIVRRVFHKVLASRLMPIFQDNVDTMQAALGAPDGAGQHLIVTSVILENLEREGGCIIGEDVENAYNSIPWDCIIAAMEAAGFPTKIKEYIIAAMEASHLSYNGKGIGNRRGVAQGDPLSSGLFCLTFDPVLRAGKKAAGGDAVTVFGCRAPTRKGFADDVLFIIKTLAAGQRVLDATDEVCVMMKIKMQPVKCWYIVDSRQRGDLYLQEGEGEERHDVRLQRVSTAIACGTKKYLGVPMGEEKECAALIGVKLDEILEQAETLFATGFHRQSCFIILRLCILTRATYLVRNAKGIDHLLPEFDDRVHRLVADAMGVPPEDLDTRSVYLPMRFGGLGLPRLALVRPFAQLGALANVLSRGFPESHAFLWELLEHAESSFTIQVEQLCAEHDVRIDRIRKTLYIVEKDEQGCEVITDLCAKAQGILWERHCRATADVWLAEEQEKRSNLGVSLTGIRNDPSCNAPFLRFPTSLFELPDDAFCMALQQRCGINVMAMENSLYGPNCMACEARDINSSDPCSHSGGHYGCCHAPDIWGWRIVMHDKITAIIVSAFKACGGVSSRIER
ncbi:hypothetical protein KIPB_009490, partial [Kipferlia bialata]|eukprot:g9490.t1